MEICTVGGYEEVGKNMTAIKINEDVIIIDAGVFLPPLMEMQQEEQIQNPSVKKLREIKALPNDKVLDELKWRKKVCAIILSHAHLDHVGAVPYIASRYPKVPIYGTPFTIEVLKNILKDEKIKIKNPIKKVNPDSTHTIKGKSKNYKVDFIRSTHSTIQPVFPVINTDEGSILYTLDFKFDNFPTLGKPPSYKKIKKAGKKGVKVLIADALYSGTERKTPSERIARNLLEDAFKVTGADKNAALFVTTFSSHIARLKSIIKFGKKTGRKIVFMGRSLHKYLTAAIKATNLSIPKKIKILKYRRQINSVLKKVAKNRGKYLVVCTGHQAENGSIMDRLVSGETPFQFQKGDNVIFSSSVIPTPVSILAREKMDKRLRRMGVRVKTDVHVSGHAGREDLRELIRMAKPEHIIPAHGTLQQETPLIELANDFGYNFGETSHLSSDGKVLKF